MIPFKNWKRRTKLIATLGPATESGEMISSLIESGVDIFRFNMSHGKPDWVREKAALIQEFSRRAGKYVGMLLDTQGPAIRTGDLPDQMQLKPGDIFTFTVRGEKVEDQHSVSVNYDDIVNDIQVGDVVLVDNGNIQMKVISKEKNFLRCEVLTPGVMKSRRHINIPGVRINLPPLTQKDLRDIQLGIECGMDFFALSFVREANDCDLLRQILISKGSSGKVIAKIEDQLAVKNLFQIIDSSDAIMIARGDLGIECPFEELPIIQRRIVKSCIQKRKPVIVATHLLESMIVNPAPTRAEITDIANAVYEQADCLMLSGETASGRYPVECVKILDRVAVRTEKSGGAGYASLVELLGDEEKLAKTAVHLADDVGAPAICVFTRFGFLASLIAGLRPRYSVIYAFCPDEEVCRKLTLNYGVEPCYVVFPKSQEESIELVEKFLKTKGIESGQKIVLISEVPLKGERDRFILLHQLHYIE
ncbi:pyruvate kinase [Methylacidiphilum kamchatkense Kam1]|uniref:Pyruvate kinase n=1 Tax=Methylacidiphilum kamchatkense Kam1 TaxID=1202785 RepID=A0A0C1RUE5_9BACT|nr:pyruvate kinase [Methylacidiphilum kamchatkense]KIE58611.1 pyruvate kinase [Methylacidiphilum kamchatkense Kam1]QDQ41342.1 pyruvate kinase [Methylacidiphilum kamchatkense Kam1]